MTVPNEPTDHVVARGREVSLRYEGGQAQRITQWCRSGVGNHRRTAAAANLPTDQKDKSVLIVSRTRCCETTRPTSPSTHREPTITKGALPSSGVGGADEASRKM